MVHFSFPFLVHFTIPVDIWTTMCILAPDLVYRTQSKWFPIPQETFNVVIYSFLGLFKIVFLVFNVVPYVALLIVG